MWKTTSNENSNKAIWSYEASVAIIGIMEGFLSDLEHPVKKKLVFNNVNEILTSMGFSGYTPLQCHKKWKNLVRTYRANKVKSNKGRCRFYFFDKMEELLSKMQLATKHTLESNDNSYVLEALDENASEDVDAKPLDTVPDETEEEIQNETTVDEDHTVGDNLTVEQFLRYSIKDIEEDESKINPVSNNEDELMEYTETNNIETSNSETIIIETSNKSWSHEASMAIIDIMENFLDDLEHPVKRKRIFSNVNEHLISMGIEGYTALQCQHKWKNLVRTYRVNKANRHRRGKATRFYFFDKMDKLLSKRFVKSTEPVSKVAKVEEITSTPVEQGRQCTVERCAHEEGREKARQKRHNDRMAIEKEKCQIERRKVVLLERILAKLD